MQGARTGFHGYPRHHPTVSTDLLGLCGPFVKGAGEVVVREAELDAGALCFLHVLIFRSRLVYDFRTVFVIITLPPLPIRVIFPLFVSPLLYLRHCLTF